MNIGNIPTPSMRTINRDDFLRIIQAGFQLEDYRFSSQAALNWLTTYAGDLPIRLFYAQALQASGHLKSAISVLNELCQIDPEYLEAIQSRLKLEEIVKNSTSSKGKPNANLGLSNSSLIDWQEWMLALSDHPAQVQRRPYGNLDQRWGEELFEARRGLSSPLNQLASKNKDNQAEYIIHQVLAIRSGIPIVAVTHAQLLYKQVISGNLPYQSLRNLVEYYLLQFPDCLQLNLFLAESCLKTRETEKAIAILHTCAARDVTGQVPVRLWGKNHPYQNIWPETLNKVIDIPIPAHIAASLGWNQLPEISSLRELPQSIPLDPLPTTEAPTITISKYLDSATPFETETEQERIEVSPIRKSSHTALPEELLEIQEELNRISSRLKSSPITGVDGRFPAYIMITSQGKLQKMFGMNGADQLDKELIELATNITEYHKWPAYLFYVDQGILFSYNSSKQEIHPVRDNDPWAIKLALLDVDTLLAKQGEMIGAVLIVGGPEIIPFHKLPNPVEDSDDEVLSDNPYGTRDENYFIPEWLVGRLPTANGSEIDGLNFLSKMIGSIRKCHSSSNSQRKQISGFQWVIELLLRLASQLNNHKSTSNSIGYTAAAWRFASFSVFRTIGDSRNMLISPRLLNKKGYELPQTNNRQFWERGISKTRKTVPSDIERTPGINLPSAVFGYFNLHGVEHDSEWFGQVDPVEDKLVENPNESDHPVALRPGDILVMEHDAPRLVFSEACFGANILQKKIMDSIALSLMSRGCAAFVGSTCTSYGSISSPLVAADYLAAVFWSSVRRGAYAGEALRQAKLSLAEKARKTKNLLDGEDQKTLISFILYGDPLAVASIGGVHPKKLFRTQTLASTIPVSCDHALQNLDTSQVSPRTVTQIREMVSYYMPWMKDAAISLKGDPTDCQLNCDGCKVKPSAATKLPSSNTKGQESPPNSLRQSQRKVIILNKQFPGYSQIARLTVDDQGKIIKLVVSR